jgi:mRNA interferase RelE/StbE
LYKIVLLSKAKKFYRKIFVTNREVFNRIDAALKLLTDDPFLGKPLKDKLRGKFSLRVGVYRIIYFIEEKEVVIYVFGIAHRREAYR